jgi:hypothetical protein
MKLLSKLSNPEVKLSTGTMLPRPMRTGIGPPRVQMPGMTGDSALSPNKNPLSGALPAMPNSPFKGDSDNMGSARLGKRTGLGGIRRR